MPGITSADVARESGVSRTTVSYVLTGRNGVSISAETRRRVHETAARLGYAPSAAARALRTGRSDLVLCILPDWPVGPVIETLLDELADGLSGRGLSVLVHHGRGTRAALRPVACRDTPSGDRLRPVRRRGPPRHAAGRHPGARHPR
ncbi:LacI family DNA-binding transcriptional regulator [Arthrobacter agilis]|uniref:LacI family DNA-binding transcriptional regulator n=1 Tax=Arthrobacter agilis TaxID=37921 RepID=UPI00277E1820|nr:LacI family DNA-binding transcriptional regulator [Arthrobacter agilis]MDQ0733692.1 DNA-binding LacI/PurR family transcriptional regulator [Arthrobacter agilis]